MSVAVLELAVVPLLLSAAVVEAVSTVEEPVSIAVSLAALDWLFAELEVTVSFSISLTIVVVVVELLVSDLDLLSLLFKRFIMVRLAMIIDRILAIVAIVF